MCFFADLQGVGFGLACNCDVSLFSVLLWYIGIPYSLFVYQALYITWYIISNPTRTVPSKVCISQHAVDNWQIRPPAEVYYDIGTLILLCKPFRELIMS